MTSVYVTNVIKKVYVTPGATAGTGGTGTNFPTVNNTWTGTNTYNNTVVVNPVSAATVPITVQGLTSQTANLSNWKNIGGTVIASVGAAGDITTATNVFVGGGVSVSGGNKVLVLSNATAPTSSPTGGGIIYAEAGALKYRDSAGATFVPIPLSGTKGDLLVHNGTAWVKVGVGTNGYVLSADSAQASGVAWAVGGGGGGHAIQDEGGASLTQRAVLNFIGAGVVATDNAGTGKTDITISASGTPYYQTAKANGIAQTQRSAYNFGTMFTLADDAGNNETDISIIADQAAGTASLRTLGSGATQAAIGTHTHSYEAVGVAAAADAAHVAAADPHPDYLTQVEADVLYATGNKVLPAGGASGNVLAKTSAVDYAVGWIAGSASLTMPYSANGVLGTDVPFQVKGAASQSVNIFQVSTSASAFLVGVGSVGEFLIGNGSSALPGQFRLIPSSAGTRGIVVRAKPSQTAPLVQIEDSAGTVMTTIGSDGTIVAPNIGPKLIVLNALDVVPGGTPTGSVILRRP